MDKEQEILLTRAKKLAVRKDPVNEFANENISVVEFLLTPERYAFDEQYISEVFSLREFTAIPGTPPFVIGVINLRGRMVSLINLKNFFNLKERGLTETNKVIILKNDQMEFGIVADSILGNKNLALNTLSPPPLTLDRIGTQYITSVTPDGLILLNAGHLLSSRQIIIT